jgi:hypothetical protein
MSNVKAAQHVAIVEAALRRGVPPFVYGVEAVRGKARWLLLVQFEVAAPGSLLATLPAVAPAVVADMAAHGITMPRSPAAAAWYALVEDVAALGFDVTQASRGRASIDASDSVAMADAAVTLLQPLLAAGEEVATSFVSLTRASSIDSDMRDFAMTVRRRDDTVDWRQPPVDYVWPAGVDQMRLLWAQHLWTEAAVSMMFARRGDLVPVMRGATRVDRFQAFTKAKLTHRERAALIDEIEHDYNEALADEDLDVELFSFRRTVLRRVPWLPGVGSSLYHGTGSRKLAADPAAQQQMYKMTFFSPHRTMALEYATSGLLELPVVHELPHPMVNVCDLRVFGADTYKTTLQLLERSFSRLFCYNSSFFTGAAEVVGRLWHTGMVVSMQQGNGSIDMNMNDTSGGLEIVLYRPARYLGAPLPQALYLDSKRATSHFEGLLFDTLQQHFRTRPAELLALLAPAEVHRWGDVAPRTAVVGMSMVTSAPMLWPLGAIDTSSTKLMPRDDNAVVNVHRIDEMNQALVRFFMGNWPEQRGLTAADYRAGDGRWPERSSELHAEDYQMLLRKMEAGTMHLMFAELEFARVAALLYACRVALGLPGGYDLVQPPHHAIYIYRRPITYWLRD